MLFEKTPGRVYINEVAVRATTKRSGARHVIWFATKKA